MRVTQNLIYETFVNNLRNNRGESARLQSELSTGKRVSKASDDNIAFTNSRVLLNQGAKENQYQANISSGLNQARTVQDALDSMIDLLIDVKSTALQGANDTLSPDERTSLSSKVGSLKEAIISQANTEYNNVHLFGGTNTQTPPFFDDPLLPGVIADNSNSTSLNIQASDSTNIQISFTGTELRTAPSGDLFVILTDLETALATDDQAGISASVDLVDGAVEHVVSLASEQGNNINRLDYLSEEYERRKISREGAVSELVDTDFTEAVLQIQKYQTAYEAALAVHSQSARVSLLDFI